MKFHRTPFEHSIVKNAYHRPGDPERHLGTKGLGLAMARRASRTIDRHGRGVLSKAEAGVKPTETPFVSG